MKVLFHSRLAVLRVIAAALILSCGVSAWVSASSLPSAGHTGQALAVRAFLHSAKPSAASLNIQKALNRWKIQPNGRFLRPNDSPFASPRPLIPASIPNGILISEGVQTFDLQAAPPTFVPADGPLSFENRTPEWSASESFVVFSSNRPSTVATDPAGHFHIWLMSSRGDVPGAATLTQVTSGIGNEFFPTLNTNSNNNLLAFTSDANSPGDQNLYVIGGQSGVAFVPGQAPVDVRSLATNPASAKTLGATNLLNVTRSTFSPGSDRIAFSASTPSGQLGLTAGVQHIFYLYLSNNGFQAQPSPGQANPPAQLTDGPANDADPAWSPDGNSIIFDSNATGYSNTGRQINPGTAITAGTVPTVSQNVNTTGNRALFIINGSSASAFGTVVNGGAQVDAAGFDDFGPAWSFNQSNQYFNPTNTLEYISFARAASHAGNHDIFYFQLMLTNPNQTVTIQPENATVNNAANTAIKLNTDDPANSYDDTYPSWSPFQSVYSMLYQSPRSVTYNQPVTNLPSESAISLPPGAGIVGTDYIGLLESQVLNLDPPSLLRFNGNQVINVTDSNGNPTRNVQPSNLGGSPTTVNFTIRLSDREALIDDNKVFLQIKDPDSRYQDSQGLEHKVFARSNDIIDNSNLPGLLYSPLGSGSSLTLFNGRGAPTLPSQLLNVVGSGGVYTVNNASFPETGAIGGYDAATQSNIAVGHENADGSAFDINSYRPWGPEYECQWLNPTHANPNTAAGDYGVPYYLAGIDDQRPFSGAARPPRPTVDNPAAADPRDLYAQYLPLHRLPIAQQDGQGGVLYGAAYQTPDSPSDFYLDVIAYDTAVFPAIAPNTSSYSQTTTTTTTIDPTTNLPVTTTTTTPAQSINWRIYDNVGGFTSETFNGANDILVVADNALGQKFAFTTFGQNRNANLTPTLYGAESYYTDVDEKLLPNSNELYVGFGTAPTPPAVPAPAATATPTQLTATAGNANVTLVFAGITPAPTQYNIYRSNAPGVIPGAPGVTQIGTIPGGAATTFVDRNVVNATTYYYVVTALVGANETNPSNEANATPEPFGGAPQHQHRFLRPGFIGGFVNEFVPMNGLGVGSYFDPLIDDGGRVDATGANLATASTVVTYVKPQKYSIWRVLSRGPVPQSVLGGYQPTFQTQPAVADTANNVNDAAASVPVANRCVIWVSPYTGALPLVDAGSLENPTTQTTLQNFLNQGGRLCITGQNVADALSVKGSVTSPLLTMLGAQYASTNGGSQTLAGAGQRISGESGGIPAFGFAQYVGGNGFTIVSNATPAGNPLFLGNNYERVTTATAPDWRADGSLDQLGPATVNFVNIFGESSGSAVAAINTITPSGNSTQDISTNGKPGLIYHEDYTSATGAGYGSRVVFASFGLEGIGLEHYEFTVGGAPFYSTHNTRPNILHNIVNYFRTGTFTGRVTQANGQGVGGATIYFRGPRVPGPRQVFSATTAFDGSFIVNGIEPGTYNATAYKSGFTTTTSNVSFSVEGDVTVNNIGLVIQPTPPGSLKGTVTDSVSGAGVSGATVTFVSTDGQTTLTAVTGPNGAYNIDNVPAGTYNGTASLPPQYSTALAPTQLNPITVVSGTAAQADFTIIANPAVVSGTVYNDLNSNNQPDTGEGIAGATLTFTPATGTAPAPVTTAADGTYTISLAPGTYTITVTAPGFVTSSSQTITVQAGQIATRNIALSVAPPVIPGFLGGLVANSFNGSPISGATITISGATLTTPITVTTRATTSSPNAPSGDGQPLNYGPQSLAPGTYTVTISAPGYTAPGPVTTTVSPNAFTRVDFTSANGNPLTPIHVFGAGYNFFSVPYDYAAAGIGFDQLFGPLNTGTFKPFVPTPSNANRSHVFVWNPQLVQYVLDPAPPADGAHLGQGYWVYLQSAHAVTVAGNSPTTPTIPVGLHQGWNQIGVPSLTAISTGNLSFANPTGGGAITFAQASSSSYHLVSPTLYGYNGSGYFVVSASSAMQPWQSYWIYAFTDTTVLIPTG